MRWVRNQSKVFLTLFRRSCAPATPQTHLLKSENNSLPDFLRSQENMQVITDSDYQILPGIDKQLIKKEAKVGDKLKIKFDLYFLLHFLDYFDQL